MLILLSSPGSQDSYLSLKTSCSSVVYNFCHANLYSEAQIVLITNCNSGRSHCPSKELFTTPKFLQSFPSQPAANENSPPHKMKGIQIHIWLFTGHYLTDFQRTRNISILDSLQSLIHKFYFTM